MGNLICKKTIIFAQGIGPVNNKFARMLTKYVLKGVDLVTVRDATSQELLKNWGIKSILVNDPVWGIEVETSIPKNKIGIQLREWKFMTDEFLIKLVRKVANDFADKEICIYSLQDKQDYDIAMRFENYLHLENPKVRTKVYHNMNIKDVIKSMKDLEYFIGMRYHAIMISIKYGIKTLAIDYAPKVEALANFAMIPSVKPDKDKEIDNAIIQMKSLSRQSLIATKDKKRFSFEIFEKEINS